MAKKKKSISFNAMVKFFMNTYEIPTKRDIKQLNARLERIERLIIATTTAGRRGAAKGGEKKIAATASDIVLETVYRYQDGVGFSDIQLQTGFDEKKLRNIIFRLHKLNKIKRISRGIYIKA